MTDTPAGSTPGTLPERLSIKPWRELALIATIVMEISWLTLWYRVLLKAGQEVSYLRAFVVLSGMMLFAYLLNRLLITLDVKLVVRRTALVLVLIVSLFIGLRLLLYSGERISLFELLNRPMRNFRDIANLIPAEFVVMLFVLLVCGRGINFADYHIGSVNTYTGFRFGIIMFFLYGLILPAAQESPNLALSLFLFSSLLAMSSARISVLSQLRGGHTIQFNRQWMLGITVFIFGIVGFAVFGVVVAREYLYNLLTALLSGIIYLSVLLFSPIIFVFLRFLVWLFETIRAVDVFNLMVEALLQLQEMIKSLMGALSQWLGKFNFDGFERFFNNIASYKPLYLWITILVIILVIVLSLRRHILKKERLDDELESEQIDEDLFYLLKSAIRKGLNKLADNLEELLRMRHARRLLAAARIRRIYARLLDLSAKLECPRPVSRTPLEFLPQLERLFPSLSSELQTITEAYLLVRYGELPESVEELSRVESAWNRVSSAGQEQLKSKPRGLRA